MLRAVSSGIATILFTLSPTLAQTTGDNYPSRAMTLVVPYAAGGVTDLVARIIGAKMSDGLGQPLVIDNRVGAGGSIGTASVVRSAPNGYTLLLGNAGTHSTSPITERGASYNPLNDFTFIAPLGSYTFVLICNPKIPVTSVAELVALAKREPGKLTYGSAGMGSNVNFIFEYFKLRAGVDFLHVPYRGAGPMINDLLTGTIDCTFDGTSKQNIDAGRLRALAVASISRDTLYPDLPTLHEAGLKDFNLPGWQSLMGPKGLSEAIIRKLNEAANVAVRDQNVIDRLRVMGFHAAGGTAQDLQKFVANDTATYRRVARDAKMQLD